MTEINITSLKNETKNDPCFKNVILNVNLKNSILSKIFSSVMIMLYIVQFFLLVILLQKIQALETQINSLTLTYQDNNRYNRASNRSIDYNDSVSSIISPVLELSNQTEVRDDRNSDTNTLTSYDQIVSNQSTDHENNTIKRNTNNFSIITKLQEKLINFFFDFNNRQNFLRSETQNYTIMQETSSDHWLTIWNERRATRLRRSEEESAKRQQNEEKGETQQQSEEKNETQRQSEEKDETQRQSEEKDETQRQNEVKGEEQRENEEKSEKRQQSEEKSEKQRQNEGKSKRWQQNEEKSGRRRQNEKKGEKRRQNRGGRKHNHNRSRPLVATFIGAVPEQMLTNTVYIGPWVKSEEDNHQYNLSKFHLVEDNMSIQVGISGLYMISVQIFYFGNWMSYSYWILLNSEGSSTRRRLVTCATGSSRTENILEMSCYTNVIKYLQKGDRLSLQQREKNRSINMREGYSQIQIMLFPEKMLK